MEDGAVRGVMAWNLDDGTIHRFRAHKVILATGGYGRIYAHLHRRAHPDRRRQCHGAARRPAAAGHGIRAVPSDRRLWRGRADHRRRARRRRLSHQFRRRALHGALCAQRQGPRLARRRLPRDDHRDPRRPRRRPEQGSHLSCICRISIRRSCTSACPAFRKARASLPASTSDQGADPGAADRALQHGRHPHELSGRSADAEGRQSRYRRARA